MKKIITVAFSLVVILFFLPAWVLAECEDEDSITWFILDLNKKSWFSSGH